MIAAVQAARDGLSAVVIENSNHPGGISAAGLGWTDFGNRETVGGLAREFYRRVGRHYGAGEAWSFEPHVAEAVFTDWLAEAGVAVHCREYLAGTTLEQGRLRALRLQSGLTVRADCFIDATYEGDLLAAAGARYTVGRDGNDAYGETINGMQLHAKHQFDYAVDPYRTPGAPGTGCCRASRTAGTTNWARATGASRRTTSGCA